MGDQEIVIGSYQVGPSVPSDTAALHGALLGSPSTLGVSGQYLTINGSKIKGTIEGVDDTTVLLTLFYFVDGQKNYAGLDQNFPTRKEG